MPSRLGYHFLNQKLGHVLRKDLCLRNIWEVVFISNHKEPFTLIQDNTNYTKFRAVTSPVGRRDLCASFGIGGGNTAGRVFPGVPALPPFSLEAQTWALLSLWEQQNGKPHLFLASRMSALPHAHGSPGPLSLLSPGEESQFEMDI